MKEILIMDTNNNNHHHYHHPRRCKLRQYSEELRCRWVRRDARWNWGRCNTPCISLWLYPKQQGWLSRTRTRIHWKWVGRINWRSFVQKNNITNNNGQSNDERMRTSMTQRILVTVKRVDTLLNKSSHSRSIYFSTMMSWSEACCFNCVWFTIDNMKMLLSRAASTCFFYLSSS